MDHKVNDAILDANERLRAENKALQAALKKSNSDLEYWRKHASAFMQIVAAIDTTDTYGMLIPAAMQPDCSTMQLRACYYNMSNPGISNRLAKLEAAGKAMA